MYTNSLRKVLTGFCRKIRQKFSPMTDKQYYKEMEKAREFTKDKRRRIKIEVVRNQWKEDIEDTKEKKEKGKPTTTKVIIFIVIALCIEMIIFAQILSWKTGDTMSIESYLSIGGTLITSFGIYAIKATIENVHKYGVNQNMNQEVIQDNNKNNENVNDININIPEPEDITCEPIKVTELTGTNESGGKG